jgi:CMP-N-acetylneuraminic acid synthetase
MASSSILITICARGGSKSIPGKNIKSLNGKPLIAFTIKAAQLFVEKHNADISLSTDDDNIKSTALQFGLKTLYTRPDNLAADTTPKVATIKHLLFFEEEQRKKKYDYILDLDVSSPLRTTEDLNMAFSMIKNDSNASNLFSVRHAQRNPYFNMVELKEDNYCKLVKQGGNIFTRQSAPKVFDLDASFYFYRRSFFEQNFQTVFTDKTLIYVMPHISFDLDEAIDFEFLAFLLLNNKLGFSI